MSELSPVPPKKQEVLKPEEKEEEGYKIDITWNSKGELVTVFSPKDMTPENCLKHLAVAMQFLVDMITTKEA